MCPFSSSLSLCPSAWPCEWGCAGQKMEQWHWSISYCYWLMNLFLVFYYSMRVYSFADNKMPCVMFYQDINECRGPQNKLTELNADVKKSFHNLRLRIQVRSSWNTDDLQVRCHDVWFSPWQDLEQMAMEQDKESDKLALISQVEGHRKQMLR